MSSVQCIKCASLLHVVIMIRYHLEDWLEFSRIRAQRMRRIDPVLYFEEALSPTCDPSSLTVRGA
jgi:hypothetical protein